MNVLVGLIVGVGLQLGAVKSEYRKGQEAKERAAKSLLQTKKRLGVGPAKPLRARSQVPLWLSLGRENLNRRQPSTASLARRLRPTSCMRITGRRESRGCGHGKGNWRKASKIAPAYNKGALQYLPDEKDG